MTVTLPPWFNAGLHEIGNREQPGNRGPVVRRYVEMAKCGAEGDPWCAIFMNAMLESTGFKGTRSALARSFEHNANFRQLGAPALGCIVTYWRDTLHSGLGHVGMYCGEDAHGYIDTLGGNESDMVRRETFNPHGARFGVSGFWWPKGGPEYVLGKLPLMNFTPQQTVAAVSTGKVT